MNVCSFIVILNAFDMRRTCDTADVQIQNPPIIYTHPVFPITSKEEKTLTKQATISFL